VLDIVVSQNVRLSEVIVSDVLDSDHLQIILHILDHVGTKHFWILLENLQIGSSFKALPLLSPRVQINSGGVEADKAARDFTASVASAYRLSTSKHTLSDLNRDLPGLDKLLKYEQRLRKLWHKTWDPVCKTAVSWVTKTIKRMTQRKTLEQWETRIGNCEVTP
jgi:hypothetical protein